MKLIVNPGAKRHIADPGDEHDVETVCGLDVHQGVVEDDPLLDKHPEDFGVLPSDCSLCEDRLGEVVA